MKTPSNTTYKALRRTEGGLHLEQTTRRTLASNEVRIEVSYAGLCRTDLYAATGRIAIKEGGVTLGHECSGRILEVGEEVQGFDVGELVAVQPWVPCFDCACCAQQAYLDCPDARMIGLFQDGAFAEELIVRKEQVFATPNLDPKVAAYLEPIAASMAVLHVGLERSAHGFVYGDDRIAKLTHQIMCAHGFERLDLIPFGQLPQDAWYDFAVETRATKEHLDSIISATRPRGTIVLKSRPEVPLALDQRAALRKSLSFVCARYAPFAAAVEALTKGSVDVTPLLGAEYTIEAYEEAFEHAMSHNTSKLFFRLNG